MFTKKIRQTLKNLYTKVRKYIHKNSILCTLKDKTMYTIIQKYSHKKSKICRQKFKNMCTENKKYV